MSSHIIGPIEGLGTVWYFEFFESIEKVAITDFICKSLMRFEHEYSRFDINSSLSQLNLGHSITRTDEWSEIIACAQEAYTCTHGIFNCLVGDELIRRGYDRDYSFLENPKESSIGNPMTDIKLTKNTITLLNNSKIDLGGFGKGFLIDSFAHLFKSQFSVSYFLINGGGDIWASSNNGQPIDIKLQHPHENIFIDTWLLYHEGFASSSPFLRSWTTANTQQDYSHLVGQKAKIQTYVKAPTAVEADIWATTLAIDPNIPKPEHVQFTLAE